MSRLRSQPPFRAFRGANGPRSNWQGGFCLCAWPTPARWRSHHRKYTVRPCRICLDSPCAQKQRPGARLGVRSARTFTLRERLARCAHLTLPKRYHPPLCSCLVTPQTVRRVCGVTQQADLLRVTPAAANTH